ncbi:D-glycero-beta-D-manno-heptose-7-phosphate kinase [bacterium]|nr:D-glycero-beta-D-manno-heptose-7-phosphate kinase [bacterium]
MDFEFFNEFSKAHLLVVGEVGIDEYIWGDTHRISPEAPVPVVEVQSVDQKLGLSANVAQNLASLGVKTSLLTVCGEDQDAKTLSKMVRDAGITAFDSLSDSTRPTLRKVRVICQKQHVVRFDFERSHALSAPLAKKFVERICDEIPKTDGVIIQDYGKGLWNADTLLFIKEARAKKKPVFVDPSRLSPVELYQGVSLLTPNLSEAEALTGEKNTGARSQEFPEAHLEKMALKILKATGCKESIITCGPWGMVAVSKEKPKLIRIPTYARKVFDVTGAGDTVIAVMSLMKVLGKPLEDCMRVANAAAGVVVGQIGAASVTPEELKKELEHLKAEGLIA